MTSDASGAEPGKDSRVEDWFGQSVERDAELVDELVEGAESGDVDDVEAEFERRSHGREEQQARHGDQIDPDQGQSAYQRDHSRDD
jgi:hypothetical protein